MAPKSDEEARGKQVRGELMTEIRGAIQAGVEEKNLDMEERSRQIVSEEEEGQEGNHKDSAAKEIRPNHRMEYGNLTKPI